MPEITPELREALEGFHPPFEYDARKVIFDFDGQAVLRLDLFIVDKQAEIVGCYLAACLNNAVEGKDE